MASVTPTPRASASSRSAWPRSPDASSRQELQAEEDLHAAEDETRGGDDRVQPPRACVDRDAAREERGRGEHGADQAADGEVAALGRLVLRPPCPHRPEAAEPVEQ